MQVPAPRDPELLAKAARLYFLDDRSRTTSPPSWGRPGRTCPACSGRLATSASSRSGSLAPAQRDHELEEALRDRYRLAEPGSRPPRDRRARRRPPGRALAGRDAARRPGWRSPGATACRRWCGPSTWSAASRSCSWSAASRPSTRPSPARSWSRAVRAHRGPPPLPARPALFGSAEALTLLLREPAIAGALDAAKRADTAIVGIGAPGIGSSGRCWTRALSPAEWAEFDAAGAVGDVCGRFYDLSGQEVGGVVNQRARRHSRRPTFHPHRGRDRGRAGEGAGASSAPCGARSSTSSSVTSRRRVRCCASTEGLSAWSFDTCGTSSPSPRSCLRPGGRAHHPAAAQLRIQSLERELACSCWSAAGGWS